MFKLASNVSQIRTALRRVQKGQVTSFIQALNKTALEIRDAERLEMLKVFDRPTRYTLNSTYVKYATYADVTSHVAIKNPKGLIGQYHYLIPQVEGGNRVQKRFEYLLRRRGILGTNEVTVPVLNSPLVRKDAYGNMSSGQIVQILSQLNSFYLAGSSQNETAALKSKRESGVNQIRYFVARKGESRQGKHSWKNGNKVQHLRSGIWARFRHTKGIAPIVHPIMWIVPKATYKKRFDFYGVAGRVAEEMFQKKFDEQYDKFVKRQMEMANSKQLKFY